MRSVLSLLAFVFATGRLMADEVVLPRKLEAYAACRFYYGVVTCMDEQNQTEAAKFDVSVTDSGDVLRLTLQMRRAGLLLRGIESNHFGAVGYIFERD